MHLYFRQREIEDQRVIYAKKNARVNRNVRGWTFMKRVLPVWFLPYSRVGILLFSASLLVGFFTYFRDYQGRDSVTK